MLNRKQMRNVIANAAKRSVAIFLQAARLLPFDRPFDGLRASSGQASQITAPANDMICHSTIEQRPLVECAAYRLY
jgi:hypothetical protein